VIYRNFLFIVCIVLLPAVASTAQSVPQFEVALGYSYMYFHPELPALTTQSLNGGGVTAVYNVASSLGIVAQMNGYSFGQGWTNKLRDLGYLGASETNMFLFQFGPQIKKHTGRWQPYASTLYGFAHSEGYAAALRAKGSGTYILTADGGNNTAFAMEIGGGLDIRLTKTVQLRAGELDYQLTRFGYKNFSANQNNLKVFTGINFTLNAR